MCCRASESEAPPSIETQCITHDILNTSNIFIDDSEHWQLPRAPPGVPQNDCSHWLLGWHGKDYPGVIISEPFNRVLMSVTDADPCALIPSGTVFSYRADLKPVPMRGLARTARLDQFITTMNLILDWSV
jgi:hypothetical protein